jgi:hypothetical protein
MKTQKETLCLPALAVNPLFMNFNIFYDFKKYFAYRLSSFAKSIQNLIWVFGRKKFWYFKNTN